MAMARMKFSKSLYIAGYGGLYDRHRFGVLESVYTFPAIVASLLDRP